MSNNTSFSSRVVVVVAQPTMILGDLVTSFLLKENKDTMSIYLYTKLYNTKSAKLAWVRKELLYVTHITTYKHNVRKCLNIKTLNVSKHVLN